MELDFAPRRPRRVDNGDAVWFSRRGADKVLDARDGADGRLELGPRLDGLREGGAELEDCDEGNAKGTGAEAIGRGDGDAHQDDGERTHDKVEDEREPLLDAQEHVERALREVEHGGVSLVEGGRPAVGADGGDAGGCLDEKLVERRFGFNVEQTDLSRGAEVVALHDKEGCCEEGHCCCQVLAQDADDDELNRTRSSP